MRLDHSQIFFVTYGLIFISVSNSLFHYVYFLSFPLFYLKKHGSLICTIRFHLWTIFSASIFFVCVLNSTYGLSQCDRLNSNAQCVFGTLIPILKKLQVFMIKHIFFFVKKVTHQIFKTTSRNIMKIRYQ